VLTGAGDVTVQHSNISSFGRDQHNTTNITNVFDSSTGSSELISCTSNIDTKSAMDGLSLPSL
jgi:hypothetical protein